jgi:hypothetical protein
MDGFEKLPDVEEKGCCKETLTTVKKERTKKEKFEGYEMKRRLD